MSVDDDQLSDRHSEQNGDSKPSTSVLLNGLRVLESFSLAEPILGVTEIARKVDLHKSSVSRILATLEKAGYVERDGSTGRFRLGLGLIALTGPLLANLDVRRIAQPELGELTRRTGETTALMVWNGHESVVVEQVQSPKEVKHTASVGTRYDTYQSSSVQVFLSEMPPGDVQRLFERRRLIGPDNADAVHAYLLELSDSRKRGYAVNDGRTSIEEVGIAAPVHDHRGVVVAAIMLSAPRFRVPAAMLDQFGSAVADAARQVSARLGGSAEAARPGGVGATPGVVTAVDEFLVPGRSARDAPSVVVIRVEGTQRMASLVLKMSVSLDGYVAPPDGGTEWIAAGRSDDALDWTVETVSNAAAHLMGATTYAAMAGYWPHATGPFAEPMNTIPKVVFSDSITSAEWGETTIVRGDLREAITRLKKERSDGYLLAHGGARFARSLIETGLIDEYRLLIHPVVLGAGERIFVGPLTIEPISTTVFSGGGLAHVFAAHP